MFVPESDHVPEEFKEVFVFPEKVPVQPGDLVVLAVRIVVAVARVPEFIAGEEHGRPPAAHEHGAGVLDHAEAQRQDIRIVRFALCAAVPAVVVIEAVGIVPAVGLVVLYVIAVQVVQGEPVVAGQEIDGRIAAPVDRGRRDLWIRSSAVQRFRPSGDRPSGSSACRPGSGRSIPPSVSRMGMSRPGRGRGVPGFCDQLDVPEDRVKGQAPEERRLVEGRTVLAATQDGSQVKAEAVHPVIRDPVAQAVQDQVLHHRWLQFRVLPHPLKL